MSLVFTVFHLHLFQALFSLETKSNVVYASGTYITVCTPLHLFSSFFQLNTESLSFLLIIGTDLREYINCKVPPFCTWHFTWFLLSSRSNSTLQDKSVLHLFKYLAVHSVYFLCFTAEYRVSLETLGAVFFILQVVSNFCGGTAFVHLPAAVSELLPSGSSIVISHLLMHGWGYLE